MLPIVSTLIVLKTEPIHLVLVGLTSVRPSDKKLLVLEFDNSTPDMSLGFLNPWYQYIYGQFVVEILFLGCF